MKQKIIMILSSLGVAGFLGKDKIAGFIKEKAPTEQSILAPESAARIESEYVDTILQKSMENITHAGENNVKSDSIIVTKVEKTVKSIEVLNKEVKVLKKENNELKKRLNNTDNVDGHFGLLPISTDNSSE
jgi:hypothetical protein